MIRNIYNLIKLHLGYISTPTARWQYNTIMSFLVRFFLVRIPPYKYRSQAYRLQSRTCVGSSQISLSQAKAFARIFMKSKLGLSCSIVFRGGFTGHPVPPRPRTGRHNLSGAKYCFFNLLFHFYLYCIKEHTFVICFF